MTRIATVAVACLLLCASSSWAHPTSSTFVIVRVNGRVVDVHITADGRALALTLIGLTDGRTPAAARGAQSRDIVTALSSDLVRLSELKADDALVQLKWIGVEDTPEREGLVTAHLTGSLLDGADALTWGSACLMGAYPLAVVAGATNASPDAYEWLAGPERSRTYRLSALATPEPAWRTIAR